MCEVEPVVVRVLDVPAGVLLPELHDLLQAALGWTDSHLHQFVADGTCYGVPDLDGTDDERDERGIPLRALPPRFRYLYDFGDGWEHEVAVLGSGGDRPAVEDARVPPPARPERVFVGIASPKLRTVDHGPRCPLLAGCATATTLRSSMPAKSVGLQV